MKDPKGYDGMGEFEGSHVNGCVTGFEGSHVNECVKGYGIGWRG